MKKLLCLSAAVLSWAIGSAQSSSPSSGFNVITTDEQTQLPSFVSFTANNRPSADGLESWIQKNIASAPNFQLRELNRSTDPAGNTHIRYRQYYQGYPVAGSMVNFHFKGTEPHSFNGVYFPTLSAPTGISISEEKAFSVAKSYFQNATFAWENAAYEKLLKEARKDQEASYYPKAGLEIVAKGDRQFALAYSFDIHTVAPFAHKLVYVDAQSGSILSAKELMMDIEVNGKAYTKYSGIQTIRCDSMDPAGFILRESDRGASIYTERFLSFGGSTGLSTEPFYDYDNVWNNFNTEMDEVATDIQWGLEKTHDYYKFKFGRNSIDGAGHELMAIAHVEMTPGEKFANAAWTGSFMIYGDGDDTSMNPLTSVDITGHEVTHGLTQETADLNYKNEPGALNESFSDIFGKSIEYYALPDSFSWKIGQKIMLPGKKAMRDMSNPNGFQHPKFYKGFYYYTGTLDDGGVHINSGVQNYWYYLLVQGGKGARESDKQPYEVKPMGFDTAARIAYMTLTSYLVPTSSYKDAANASLAYTKLTYGDSSDQAYNVQMAWYAVGLLDKPVKKDTVVTTPPTAVPDVPQAAAVSIYPNPGSGIFTIVSANAFADASLQLSNLTGQVILTQEHINGTSVSVDASQQASGMYILEIRQGGIVTSRTKIMKK
ncbi:MAG: M4 family metallopeptidase [Chitinophagaceae bacterium]|nr:M4 family metallopeptidase [Chitinophagaceae bacterium]